VDKKRIQISERGSSPTAMRGVRTARWLVVSLLLVGAAAPGFAGEVKLSTDQVPKVSEPLKRLKLSPATPPLDFAKKVLANVAPGKELEPLGKSKFGRDHHLEATVNVLAAIDDDHVVAVVDPGKGHVDVMPSLEKLTPLARSDGKTVPDLPAAVVERADKVAAAVLAEGVFGKDATRPVLDKMLTLEAAEFDRPAPGKAATMNPAKSGPVLATYPVRRQVGELPVFGRGSNGLISVGAEGRIYGFSKHWQTAADLDQVTEHRSPDQIAALIREQLAPLATNANVVVQDVQLGYYDGDEKYIQPVYQFRAKVTYEPTKGERGQADDDFVAGYIPIGEVLEPIPSLLDTVKNPPVEPPKKGAAGSASASVSLGADQAADPTVGRYVVRNDYAGWVNSANGFWNGIQASGWGGFFSNSQYYWAYPFEFQGSKNYYINAVNVAEIEVHGDWWLFTTYQNWGDVVTIDSIPSPGLGASAGGSAAYFMIHSCEVVPAAVDTGAWPDHWWHVFGGLHSVLGYRTIMYIDDGVMYWVGLHMAWGSNLVSTWLQDVASSPLYWFRPGEVMHGVWKPYGRPSTISVCGHESDSVYNTSALPAAGCLVNYWYN